MPKSVTSPRRRGAAAAPTTTAPPRGTSDPRRVVIENVRPLVDCGELPAKASVGLPLEVSADIIADGHDLLMAAVRHGPARGGARETAPMQLLGNDRWSAWITPAAMGPWQLELLGMPDDWGSFARDLERRFEAGQDLSVELLVGVQICEERLSRSPAAADATALRRLRDLLADARREEDERVAAVTDPGAADLLRRTADWETATHAGPYPLFVDRELGAFSAWYEMFPRSEGAVPEKGRSGTFATAARRLPDIAAMGFDIVYVPPVHPIGHTHRKGRNNALTAGPRDPGSPWAIGDRPGGHDAVHPDLGTVADFERYVAAARKVGLEVAIDFAIQCSPDHPWVREHPSWFRHRPDGSIRYAENPPKRYQDIYPVDFDNADRAELDAELLRIVLLWIERGVRVFRVDNPHTKPLRFWQWLIGEVRREHPDVLFLSEAFTRPRVMERLAKFGFTQSYTYFTWRNSKEELTEYLTELSQTPVVDFMRPNFWTNTPDILHETLQRGGPPAFRLRAVLAALCSPSWGMYSGYELCEDIPLREGSEEYWESEKYQLRPRRWDTPGSLAPLITRLNEIRRRHHDAVAQLRTLRVHPTEGDHLLCVSRADHEARDVILVIVNLDATAVHDGTTWLDLEALGLDPRRPFECRDELSGDVFTWWGPRNYVRLDPAFQPAHVLHVRQSTTA
jgi:starch synthase (maltosyl-transferring)